MKEKTEKNNGNTVSLSAARRILAYIFRYYKGSCLIVAASILISALATLCGTLFMRELIDSYIVPLLNEAAPDFGPLAARLLSLPPADQPESAAASELRRQLPFHSDQHVRA